MFYNGDISSPSIFHVPKGRKTLPPIFQKGGEYSLLCLWRDEDISLPSFWKEGWFFYYFIRVFILFHIILPQISYFPHCRILFYIFSSLFSFFSSCEFFSTPFKYLQWGTFFSSFLSSLFFLGIHSIFLFIFCHFSSRYPQEENLTVNGLFQSTPLLELFPLPVFGDLSNSSVLKKAT